MANIVTVIITATLLLIGSFQAGRRLFGTPIPTSISTTVPLVYITPQPNQTQKPSVGLKPKAKIANTTQPPIVVANDGKVDCYFDGKHYRVTKQQCDYAHQLKDYSLYIQNLPYEDTAKQIVDQFGKDVSAISGQTYQVNPNISNDAVNQMNNTVNGIIDATKIITPTPTLSPCANLEGEVHIEGGSCN